MVSSLVERMGEQKIQTWSSEKCTLVSSRVEGSVTTEIRL